MSDWIKYLEDLLGEPVRAVPDPAAEQHLPIFLGTAYRIFQGTLVDRPTRFAVPRNLEAPLTIDSLLQHHAALRRQFGEDLVLVLSTLPAYGIKRLVKERVPFLVPGQQVFLPRNIVHLRGDPTGGAISNHVEDSPLSMRSQTFLLYHLQRQSLALQTQIRIAEMLGWPAMTVSRAIRELQQKRLCYTLPGGRSNLLSIERCRSLWERALPHMVSPVKARRYVRILKPDELAPQILEAGLSALSRYTMINADPVAVFAVHHGEVDQLTKNGVIQMQPYRGPDDSILELWRYDPAFLATEAQTVDRLSLYLSLRNSSDERVQGALGELLEGMPW